MLKITGIVIISILVIIYYADLIIGMSKCSSDVHRELKGGNKNKKLDNLDKELHKAKTEKTKEASGIMGFIENYPMTIVYGLALIIVTIPYWLTLLLN